MKTHQKVLLACLVAVFIVSSSMTDQASRTLALAYLSPAKMAAIKQTEQDLRDLQPYDIVNVGDKAFVAKHRMSGAAGSMVVEGPGPGSNPQKKQLAVGWDHRSVLELTENAKVKVLVYKRNTEAWRQTMDWYALQ